MTERPSEFRIHFQVEVRMQVIHDLLYLEVVEAQQPIGLIQTVLTYQRWLLQNWQTRIVGIHTDIARIIYAPHSRLAVEHRRHLQDILVSFFRSPYNHLRGLSGRYETGCMTVFPAVFLVF